MPSRSRRFSRSSWRRWVTKTDSAILLVAMKPVYLPLLRVRAVNSEVPWYAKLPWEDVKGRKPCHSCFPRVGLYGTVGGRARCWNPSGGRLGSKSLGLVEWGMGCEVAVEQVPCRHGQVAVVVGCACRSMVVE